MNKWFACIHEAGHAAVAQHLGFKVTRITTKFVLAAPPPIAPSSRYVKSGDAYRRRHPWETAHVRDRLTYSAAGEMAAQWILAAEKGGGGDDYEKSVAYLRQMGADARVIDRQILAAQRRALKLVIKLKPEILAIAERLMAGKKEKTS